MLHYSEFISSMLLPGELWKEHCCTVEAQLPICRSTARLQKGTCQSLPSRYTQTWGTFYGCEFCLSVQCNFSIPCLASHFHMFCPSSYKSSDFQNKLNDVTCHLSIKLAVFSSGYFFEDGSTWFLALSCKMHEYHAMEMPQSPSKELNAGWSKLGSILVHILK